MAVARFLIFITMLLDTMLFLSVGAANIIINTSTCNAISRTFAPSNNSCSATLTKGITVNTAVFAALAAPLYRNVTFGEAWVFPSSANDLGARDLSCECFNPDDQCCMPTSSDLAPFCMPIGSTCCGNTFCVAGESCCGGFCCPANTLCNLKLTNSGCCPLGAICSGPPTCSDHASPNCSSSSNGASPQQQQQQQQCCPSSLPFCRDFQPIGVGCYASSATASSSTLTVPSMTAAGTADIFVPDSPSSASYSSALVSKDTGTSSMNSDILTVTILVVSDQHGGLSLQFLTRSPDTSVNEGEEGAKTTYVLEWAGSVETAAPVTAVPSSDVTGTSGTGMANSLSESQKTTTSGSMSSSMVAPSSPSAATTTIRTPSSSSTPSPLCYDPTANSHSPCPTTTTTSPPSSTSSSSRLGAFNPPSATIVPSQASIHPPPIPLLLSLLRRLRDFISALYPTLLDDLLGLLLLVYLLFVIVSLALSISSIVDHVKHLLGSKEQRIFDIAPVLRHDLGYTDDEIEIVTMMDPAERRGYVTFADLLSSSDDKSLKSEGGIQDEATPGAGKNQDPTTITVVPGSAKPLLEPRVVEKDDIHVVKGSGRVYLREKRTHSLWEGMAMAGRMEGADSGSGSGSSGGEEEGEGGKFMEDWEARQGGQEC